MGQQGKMHRAFHRWRKKVGYEYEAHAAGKEDQEGGKEIERTYGIKHLGRAGSTPKIHVQTNPRNGCLRTPEAYILARGAITLPYLTHIIYTNNILYVICIVPEYESAE
eukprot:6198144-Pleurochrysis_carterae.AAC.1